MSNNSIWKDFRKDFRNNLSWKNFISWSVMLLILNMTIQYLMNDDMKFSALFSPSVLFKNIIQATLAGFLLSGMLGPRRRQRRV